MMRAGTKQCIRIKILCGNMNQITFLLSRIIAASFQFIVDILISKCYFDNVIYTTSSAVYRYEITANTFSQRNR